MIITVVRRVRWRTIPHGEIGERWRTIIVQMINYTKKRKKMRQTQKPKKITRKCNTKHNAVAKDLFCRLVESDFGCECVREYRFHPTRRWRFDYAIAEHRIAVEVEGGVFTGGRHTRPTGFLGDVEKYNTATLYGWRLFRVTPSRLISASTMQLLHDAITLKYVKNK